MHQPEHVFNNNKNFMTNFLTFKGETTKGTTPSPTFGIMTFYDNFKFDHEKLKMQ